MRSELWEIPADAMDYSVWTQLRTIVNTVIYTASGLNNVTTVIINYIQRLYKYVAWTRFCLREISLDVNVKRVVIFRKHPSVKTSLYYKHKKKYQNGRI
jgi:hypothetical protein